VFFVGAAVGLIGRMGMAREFLIPRERFGIKILLRWGSSFWRFIWWAAGRFLWLIVRRRWYHDGMRPSLAVEAHRDAIVEIVRRHRGLNPRVFGSAARGDDREDSDLDLLVDPAPGMTLFDVGGIINEVETLLG